MDLSTIFVLFIMMLRNTGADNISASFTRTYYANRSIYQLVVFECWDPGEKLQFARNVMQLDTKISFAPIVQNLDMKRILKVNYYRIGVILDFDCPESEIILEQFSRSRLAFNESYHWLVFTELMIFPTDALRHVPFTVESEMTFASRRQDSYVLHDVYNPSYRHNGSLNVTFKGVWSPRDGLYDELTQYKYIRRGNFHGLALNFSIVLTNPPLPDLNTYLTKPINRHLDTMTRYHWALIMQLKDVYNFSNIVRMLDDHFVLGSVHPIFVARINLQHAKTWGYLINGTWNGILADMQAGLVDVSACPFQFKEERMDVCEFTVVTLIVRTCIIFRHPKKSDLRNPFLKPFASSAWYMIAIFGIIYWLLLFLTAKIEQKYRDKAPSCTLDTHPASETSLITVAAISQQGLSDGSRIISGRIVFLSLFLWGFLLYQFYSASVVGSLLAETPRFITTIKDLMDSNIDVFHEDMVYYYDFFRTIKDPLVLAFYDKKVKPTKKRPKGSYTDARTGLRLVKKGGYAFHVDTATAYKIITETFTDDEICDLQEIELLTPRPVTLVTSKKSPFKKMLTYGLRRTVQHGMTSGLRQTWLARRPQCPESHSSTPVPVHIEEFSPALFLMLIGSAFAASIMILEHCYIRRTCWQAELIQEPMSDVSLEISEADTATLDEPQDSTDIS